MPLLLFSRPSTPLQAAARVCSTAADDPVVHVSPDQQREALPPTPGMVRQEAIAVEGLWAGVATTDAGMTSAWHHHGDYDTSIYANLARSGWMATPRARSSSCAPAQVHRSSTLTAPHRPTVDQRGLRRDTSATRHHGRVDRTEVDLLRPLVEGAGLTDAVVDLSAALGSAPHGAGGLLLVGTPTEEPWHFAAHLSDEARWSSRADLEPTLLRWQVPADAPAHLAVGVQRLESVRRAETVLVVSPGSAPDPLLERLSDARRHGALVLTIDRGDHNLGQLAHERLTVPESAGPLLDVVQHLVSQTAASGVRRRSLRERINRLLDTAQGLRSP